MLSVTFDASYWKFLRQLRKTLLCKHYCRLQSDKHCISSPKSQKMTEAYLGFVKHPWCNFSQKLSRSSVINVWLDPEDILLTHFRSNRPEVFLRKGVMKICSTFTEEHLCQVWFQISHPLFIFITQKHATSYIFSSS